jgi:hypothetical protein
MGDAVLQFGAAFLKMEPVTGQVGPFLQAATSATQSNTAMLSTWAVCGNILTTPAALQR